MQGSNSGSRAMSVLEARPTREFGERCPEHRRECHPQACRRVSLSASLLHCKNRGCPRNTCPPSHQGRESEGEGIHYHPISSAVRVSRGAWGCDQRLVQPSLLLSGEGPGGEVKRMQGKPPCRGSRGVPRLKFYFPLSWKERGIKGVRSTMNREEVSP